MTEKIGESGKALLVTVDLKSAVAYVSTIVFSCIVSSFSVYFVIEQMIDKGIIQSETVMRKDIDGANSIATDALDLSYENASDIVGLKGDVRALTESQNYMMRELSTNFQSTQKFEDYMRSRIDLLMQKP